MDNEEYYNRNMGTNIFTTQITFSTFRQIQLKFLNHWNNHIYFIYDTKECFKPHVLKQHFFHTKIIE